MKKLVLKKEVIAQLGNTEMKSLIGGAKEEATNKESNCGGGYCTPIDPGIPETVNLVCIKPTDFALCGNQTEDNKFGCTEIPGQGV